MISSILYRSARFIIHPSRSVPLLKVLALIALAALIVATSGRL